MRTVGFGKLCQLMGTASPTSRLITPDRDTDDLVRRGLMHNFGDGGYGITANGLRQLADEMNGGFTHRAIERLQREQAARKAKRAAKAG